MNSNAVASSKANLSLDHLLIGVRDLTWGCDYLEQYLGVRPVEGGSHPGQGTRNAILVLEDGVYLEVIAPDPAQGSTRLSRYLQTVERPALLWWAVRVDDLDVVEEALSELSVDVSAHVPGERELPDAQGVLRWELLLADGAGLGNTMPFFIDWHDMKHHPSTTAPAAGRLQRFETNLSALSGLKISNVCFGDGESLPLLAIIETAGGSLELQSPEALQPSIVSLH